jgi:ribosomal protein L25 (general stress protein Ctc)
LQDHRRIYEHSGLGEEAYYQKPEGPPALVYGHKEEGVLVKLDAAKWVRQEGYESLVEYLGDDQ